MGSCVKELMVALASLRKYTAVLPSFSSYMLRRPGLASSRIGSDLLRHVLDVPGLDIELALYDLGGAERTDLGLVPVHGGKEIIACLMQEITDSLHIVLVY